MPSSVTSLSAAPAVSTRAHLGAVLGLGLPLIGSFLAQMSMGLIDTLMMGWYGVDELAGMVLGSTLFFTLMLMGAGFGWAVMPLAATAREAGDTAGLRRVTRMGLWVSLLAGLATLPVLWFSAPILEAIGQQPRLAAIAQEYLRIAALGMVPLLLSMVLRSYLTAMERPGWVLQVTLAAAGLNAGLNYLLIFGNFGAPELGVRGAAVASAVVQGASLLALAGLAGRNFPAHRLFARLWRPDWRAFAQVARMGMQIGLTSLAETGLFAASTLIMGYVGVLELAAHGIAIQIVSLFFMVHVGLSNVATVRAGQALGRGDAAGLRQGARVVLAVSGGFALVSVAVFLALPEALIGLFLDPDEPLRAEILAVGRALLAVAALFQLVDAAQVMALGLLRGVQDTRAPMLHAVFSYWLVGVPLSWFLGIALGWGGVGVWSGLVIGLGLAAVLMQGRFWLKSSHIGRGQAA